MKSGTAPRYRINSSVIHQILPVALVALSTVIILLVIGKPVNAVDADSDDGTRNSSAAVQMMANDPALSSGIRYLSAQEAKSPDVVDEKFKEKKLAELRANLDVKRQLLLNGDVDVWTLFDDYALMGDSRAYGFFYYGFMPDERVFAKPGATINMIPERLDELKLLNPSRIYLCFGMNDTGIGIWTTPESYAAAYQEVLETVKKELPGVTFYVNSILIAKDPAFKQNSAWRNIPAYSQAVKEMCEREGYVFVDNSNLEETYLNLWDSDGIHFQKSFYPHWATNMILTEYDVEAKAALEAEESKLSSDLDSTGNDGASGDE